MNTPPDESLYDVFLSHNSDDKPAVEELGRRLEDEEGIKPFLDKWHLIPGEPWQEALEEALKESKTVAVFLGPSGISPWHNEEMRAALNRRTRIKSFRVIPVLLPGSTKPDEVELPEFLARLTWVDFWKGLDDAEAFHRLVSGIRGVAPGRGTFDDLSAPAPATPANWYLAHPYPMPPNFTGRIAEREALSKWLAGEPITADPSIGMRATQGNPVLVMTALGGFGKSALAWHWLIHDLDATRWPRVVWWSFYEPESHFEGFTVKTLAYLEIDPSKLNPRDRVEALLRALNNPGTLLVLDGFERELRAYAGMGAAYQGDETDEEEQTRGRETISPLAEWFIRSAASLPNLRGRVLITTRLRPRPLEDRTGEILPGCAEMELTQMHPKDALAFLRAQGVRGERAEIIAACRRYGFHPLTLRLLAGYIAQDFERPGDISVADKLDLRGDQKQRQHHVLKVAYQVLAPERQTLLSRMAAFRGPVSYAAIRAIALPPETEEKETEETREAQLEPLFLNIQELDTALRGLLAHGLVHRDPKAGTFDLHPIVRRYAYDRLGGDERAAAHGQLRDYFAAVPEPEKVERLEDLAPVIELYHHTVRAGEYDQAFRLYRNRLSDPIYFQFGAYQLQSELLRAVFPDGEDQPPRLKEESDQAWTLNSLANSYSLSGQPRRAVPLFEGQIAIRERQNHKPNLAIGLGNLASLAQIHLGALRAAAENLRRAITMRQEIGYSYVKAIAPRELGRVLAFAGAWKEAADELGTALSIEGQINVQGQSVTWAYSAQRAILMSRDIGDEPTSRVESETHLQELTLTASQRALALAEETAQSRYPHPRDFVRAYWLLGTAERLNGDQKAADRHLTEALTRCREINMVDHEADILIDLSRLRLEQGESARAKELAEEALIITERSEYVLQGADAHLLLAALALEEGDKDAAREHAEQAKELAYCDGPPYTYKVALAEAEEMLRRLEG